MSSDNRGLAVAFALLMVLSMVAPVVATAQPAPSQGPPGQGNGPDEGGPPGQGNGGPPGQDNGNDDGGPPTGDDTDRRSFDENASSLDLRIRAYQRIENASIRGGPNANDRLQERINDTFSYYVGANRVDSVRIFDEDTAVISRTKQTAPQVADLLLASQARFARAELRDANRTVHVLQERGAEFNERRSANQLDQARRHFDRGDDRYDREQRNAAIAGYRHAFIRSHRLLNRLHRSTDPVVRIEDRQDPIRNGSANYTLRGTVSAVRASQLQNLTVTVDGEQQEVPLRATAEAGAEIPFATTVRLEDRVATIEAEAATTSARSGRVVGSDTATLRLDGDGLSDLIEENVTGTDPLDPDSDAPATDADESDDGVIDGREDFDGDRLATITELDRGLDPLANDTDDDGLDDRAEVLITDTDPLDPDTDDDGVLDGAEDPDGDGLTNAEEVEAGSHYNATDGDRDGLTDPEEIELGTEPLLADSDDDGLYDGEELELDTDPLDPDTDDDGVLDGNETYRTTAGNESVGVELRLHGPGNIGDSVRIQRNDQERYDNDAVANASVTPIVDLETDRRFQRANVSFEYDDAPDVNESDLAVFTFNSSVGTFVPLNTSIDSENDTVHAETTHFSTFVVFDVSNWASAFEANTPPSDRGGDDGDVRPLDVAFVIDSSGSMGWNDPSGYRKSAAREFVGALLDVDRAAVVDYDHRASVTQSLTRDFDAVNASIGALDSSGGTDISGGVSTGLDHLLAGSNASRARTMILLADGQGGSAQSQAERAAANDVTIHTIGFGNADESELESIATETDGSFHAVGSAEELPEVFSRVAENTTGGVDSDDDGLTDAQETGGMLIGTGENVTTNPEEPDTDGDLLLDGDEVGEYVSMDYEFTIGDRRVSLDEAFYATPSHPLDVDSDDDGVGDYPEREGWNVSVVYRNGSVYRWNTSERLEPGETTGNVTFTSDPWDSDTDDDGLPDDVERDVTHTDPNATVTYGITQEHQRSIIDPIGERAQRLSDSASIDSGYPVSEMSRLGFVRTINFNRFTPRSLDQLQTWELNDATDDFDYVVPEDYDSGETSLEDLAFTSLSGEEHFDVWLPNAVEEPQPTKYPTPLTEHTYDIDPWDPDTDDDGLTDGQEMFTVPSLEEASWPLSGEFDVFIETVADYNTHPDNPDTDRDGEWDGYIGVHGVGRTDNLVLYRHNLQDGGINGSDVVPEQAQVHEIDHLPPSTPGTDIDSDGVQEHSNIHIGERLRGTSPTDDHDTPMITYTAEVDTYAGASGPLTLHEDEWVHAIERNYALYGIDVSLTLDDTLDEENLDNPWQCTAEDILLDPLTSANPMYAEIIERSPGSICIGTESGFDLVETIVVQYNHEDMNADDYIFIGHEPGPALEAADASAINYWRTPLIGVYTGQIDATFDSDDVRRSPYDTNHEMGSAAVVMHEIGHSLEIGEVDDQEPTASTDSLLRLGEVYSGDTGDPSYDDSPESIRSGGPSQWSIMAETTDGLAVSPMDGRYLAFSIEELLSIEEP